MNSYLIFNAVLYFALALWCIFLPEKTSGALGFQLMNGSGRSEYLVVYGGMQLGLALFFALCVYRPEWNLIGVLFASCIYLPILTCRVLSFLKFEGIGSVTIGTACLEVLLTIWGIYLLKSNWLS